MQAASLHFQSPSQPVLFSIIFPQAEEGSAGLLLAQPSSSTH